MENDFDKTIDALLRNARDPSLTGNASFGTHLDADELSMFAENASPAAFRQKQAAHIANCGNCRKILAQLISLNADKAEPILDAPEIHTEAANSIPWYRRLFIYPNIAYVMGSLVVVFGGLLAFTLISNNSKVNISRSTENFPQSEASSATANRSVQSGPSDEASQNFDRSFTANSANSNSNSAALTRTQNPLIAAESDTPAELQKDEAVKSAAKPSSNASGYVLDGQSNGNVGGGRVAQAPARAKSEAELNDREDKQDMRAMSAPAPPPSTEILSEKKRSRAYSEPSKTVGGQRFFLKEGVWYDVRYNGQPTINIRRDTSEYKKLDHGLKDIAEKLDRTAVILWKEKAYRISTAN
jgi:hypothetical protein